MQRINNRRREHSGAGHSLTDIASARTFTLPTMRGGEIKVERLGKVQTTINNKTLHKCECNWIGWI